MRGGKEKGNMTSPMFPRLHVNDTEKGGPRAPPRNKMALYEQLSIPSQKISSGSTSMLPLPPNNSSSLLPSVSSSNGGALEKSMFSLFCNSPAPSFLAEKLHSSPSSGIKLNTTMENQEKKSVKPTNYGNLNNTGTLSSTAKSSSFKPCNFSNFRQFSLKKLGDKDDVRALSSVQFQTALDCSNSLLSKDKKYKQKKRSRLGDIKSRPYSQIDENTSQTSEDPVDSSASISLHRDGNLADASSICSSKVQCPESLKRPHSSLNQENRSSSMDILNGLRSTNSRFQKECVALRDEMALTGSILMETAGDIGKENALKVRTESCLRPSLRDNNSSSDGLENGSECYDDKDGGSAQVREVDTHNDVSNTSMLNSISALGISPDDVVGTIGEKQFWKARRSIINQQRVFTEQVFELHRLMKVQRSIARSPHLLLEDSLYTGKPPLNTPQAKQLQSEYILEPAPLIVKAKNYSQKPDPITECANENTVANIPHPSVNCDTSKGLMTQQSNYGSYSANAPVSKNSKPSPWWFPPPGNQWLVSVMSPTEGLVYKPYAGPYPHTAGFAAPFYGSCGPVNFNPTGADFLNTAYGVPASRQQGIGILPATPPLGPTYFPPYGMPVMSQSVSGSAVEQMSCCPEVQSKDNHLPMVDINFMTPHKSSHNMSNQMSRVLSCCLKNFQASAESEVQGSTASSPSTRAKGDALPLFPMEPIVQASDQNSQTSEQPTRVIKVVPCNPGLATESAARIFQSIQEERKQSD